MYQRTTFNVVFFCKKTKISKKGKAPIYARITTSGQTTEIYTQCQIEPERWNQRLERSLYKDEVDQQINSIVASYRANILAAYDLLLKENKTPDCFSIKQRLSNASGSRMFLAEFSKYCDKRQQEVGTRITQVTCNKYHRLLRYLTEYTRQQYRKDDLPLNVADSLHLPSQTDVCGSDIPFQPAYMAHSGRFGAFRFGTGVPATAAIPSLSASVPATRVPAPKRNSDRRKDRNRASVSVAGADTCRRQTTKRW